MRGLIVIPADDLLVLIPLSLTILFVLPAIRSSPHCVLVSLILWKFPGIGDRTNISGAILRSWRQKAKPGLPSVAQLPGILDQPLPEMAKIPLPQQEFNDLLSSLVRNLVQRADLEILFRVSDVESSFSLVYSVCHAVTRDSPSDHGSEASFHAFWDNNIRDIFSLLVPTAQTDRDTSQGTKLRPDFVLIEDKICAFRGEEKSPSNREDPKAELTDKLTWTYSPAPYVFGEHNYSRMFAFSLIRAGYYAVGSRVTLTAICAPLTSQGRPYVQDLASADLRFTRDRILQIRRLINLSPYIRPLVDLIGFRDSPDFMETERYGLGTILRSSAWQLTLFCRNDKVVVIGIKSVKKTYLGHNKAERVRYIQNIYHQLKEKAVPHVDALILVVDSSIYVEPKGISVRPSNEKELLDAIDCVLSALVVCFAYFEVVTCIFTSRYRFSTNHQCYYIETSDGPMLFGVLTTPLCGFSLIGTMLPVPIMSQQIIWMREVTHLKFLRIIMEVKWIYGVSECLSKTQLGLPSTSHPSW